MPEVAVAPVVIVTGEVVVVPGVGAQMIAPGAVGMQVGGADVAAEMVKFSLARTEPPVS